LVVAFVWFGKHLPGFENLLGTYALFPYSSGNVSYFGEKLSYLSENIFRFGLNLPCFSENIFHFGRKLCHQDVELLQHDGKLQFLGGKYSSRGRKVSFLIEKVPGSGGNPCHMGMLILFRTHPPVGCFRTRYARYKIRYRSRPTRC